MSGVFMPELNMGMVRPGTGSRMRRIIRCILSVFARTAEKDRGNVKKPESGMSASADFARENAAHLLDAHGDSILRLAYSYLHNMQDAEDILQETLIRYMKAGPEFDNETHARAWLLRVAANLSKNRIEYNRYRMADELNEELVAEEREDLSFVWEAVKSLPVSYRETIHLFYQEGYRTAQIAEILGEKESTVRSHLKRGREKLREILKEAYDFEE